MFIRLPPTAVSLVVAIGAVARSITDLGFVDTHCCFTVHATKILVLAGFQRFNINIKYRTFQEEHNGL